MAYLGDDTSAVFSNTSNFTKAKKGASLTYLNSDHDSYFLSAKGTGVPGLSCKIFGKYVDPDTQLVKGRESTLSLTLPGPDADPEAVDWVSVLHRQLDVQNLPSVLAMTTAGSILNHTIRPIDGTPLSRLRIAMPDTAKFIDMRGFSYTQWTAASPAERMDMGKKPVLLNDMQDIEAMDASVQAGSLTMKLRVYGWANNGAQQTVGVKLSAQVICLWDANAFEKLAYDPVSNFDAEPVVTVETIAAFQAMNATKGYDVFCLDSAPIINPSKAGGPMNPAVQMIDVDDARMRPTDDGNTELPAAAIRMIVERAKYEGRGLATSDDTNGDNAVKSIKTHPNLRGYAFLLSNMNLRIFVNPVGGEYNNKEETLTAKIDVEANPDAEDSVVHTLETMGTAVATIFVESMTVTKEGVIEFEKLEDLFAWAESEGHLDARTHVIRAKKEDQTKPEVALPNKWAKALQSKPPARLCPKGVEGVTVEEILGKLPYAPSEHKSKLSPEEKFKYHRCFAMQLAKLQNKCKDGTLSEIHKSIITTGRKAAADSEWASEHSPRFVNVIIDQKPTCPRKPALHVADSVALPSARSDFALSEAQPAFGGFGDTVSAFGSVKTASPSFSGKPTFRDMQKRSYKADLILGYGTTLQLPKDLPYTLVNKKIKRHPDRAETAAEYYGAPIDCQPTYFVSKFYLLVASLNEAVGGGGGGEAKRAKTGSGDMDGM